MKRHEIETLRAAVSCDVVLERNGWEMDRRESTRRAVKYRRGAAIVIVTHDGHGWFDPLSEARGDVFALTMLLHRIPFPAAIDDVASMVGLVPVRRSWAPGHPTVSSKTLAARWMCRPKPSVSSRVWHYLCRERVIPACIVQHAIDRDCLREGPFGSMWAAHLDSSGGVVGWEERGPQWRGFSTGGSKILFRLGSPEASRLCVTEAAIDAMSLAALEGSREGTLYLSTGGGWSPATDAALAMLASRSGCILVAATDANSQGDVYAERLRVIAQSAGSDWHRLRPSAEDWNEVLQNRERKIEREGEVCRMRAGRSGEVMKD